MPLIELRNLTKVFVLAETPFGSRVGEIRADAAPAAMAVGS